MRAMSNVWARMLIAGTVNPEISPRARAMYSSWMLAERAPSIWAASQTIHWAASTVAGSVANAAVQARSRIPSARRRWTSSISSAPSWTCAIPVRRDSSSVGDSATKGMPRWYRRGLFGTPLIDAQRAAATRRRRVGASERLDDHEEHDGDEEDRDDHAALPRLL